MIGEVEVWVELSQQSILLVTMDVNVIHVNPGIKCSSAHLLICHCFQNSTHTCTWHHFRIIRLTFSNVDTGRNNGTNRRGKLDGVHLYAQIVN